MWRQPIPSLPPSSAWPTTPPSCPTSRRPASAAYLTDAKELLALLDAAAVEAAAVDARGDDAIDAVSGGQIARRVVRAFETRRVQREPARLSISGAAYGVLLLMIKEIGTPAERVEAMAGRLRALPGVLEEGLANLRGPLPQPFIAAALDDLPGMRELVGEAAPQAAAELRLCRGARRARPPGGRGGRAASAPSCGAGSCPTRRPRSPAAARCSSTSSRTSTCFDETPEQIAAVGRAAVADTRAAMAELSADDGLRFDGERRRRGPGRRARAARAARRATARRSPRLASFVVAHDLVTLAPDEELVVEATPPALRGSLPFAAYEGAGPYDRLQRGYYWVTVPAADLPAEQLARALAGHPYASMPTVGVHEAFPGHHTQFGRANRASTLARRVAFIPDGGTLLIEGWAFYCEEMMEAQGFLGSPAVRLMRLNDQLWRACRVVIDMELHLGLMSFDEAVEFLSREAHLERSKAELEVRWYVGAPGYPMAYLIGKREIMALAADYARRRSPSLKAFHDELLEWGATTPALIRRGMGLDQRD